VYSPDPGFLIFCIEASGGEVGNSILVSNDANDLKMAKSAHVPSIAVSKQQAVADAVTRARPDLIVDSLSGIPDAIIKLKDSSTY